MLAIIRKLFHLILTKLIESFKNILMKMNIYLSENLLFDKSRNKVFQIIINPEFPASTTMSKTFFEKEVFIQTGDFRSQIDENNYEEVSRILFLKNIQNQLGPLDFFDIGANYGLYSVLLNDQVSLTIVEPNPFIVHCLNQTFFNRKKCNIEESALTSVDEDKECVIDIMPRHSGASSLKGEVLQRHKFLHEKFALTVNAISLPNLVKKYTTQNQIAIFKIDVEGIEFDIFSSKKAIESISSNYKNFIIFMELIPSMINQSELDILNSTFGDFFSIVLSNKNLRSDLKHSLNDFNLSNYYKNISPIKFTSILDMVKMNEFDYADITIFSDKEILKNIESCL